MTRLRPARVSQPVPGSNSAWNPSPSHGSVPLRHSEGVNDNHADQVLRRWLDPRTCCLQAAVPVLALAALISYDVRSSLFLYFLWLMELLRE